MSPAEIGLPDSTKAPALPLQSRPRIDISSAAELFSPAPPPEEPDGLEQEAQADPEPAPTIELPPTSRRLLGAGRPSTTGSQAGSPRIGFPRRTKSAPEPSPEIDLDSDGEQLDVVARLEVELPRSTSFVLRATLPVPPGLEDTDPGSSVLALRDRDPEQPLVPLQWEVVVRDGAGRPEVIEVLAPLRRAPRDMPGSRVQYAVVRHETPIPQGPRVPSSAKLIFGEQATQRPLLRARDVHGNVYELDITGWAEAEGFGSARTLASGPAVRRRRVAGVLTPVELSGDGPPMPHLMGVHAYWGQWAFDGRLSLDLRIHNGTTSGSRESGPLEETLGPLYWESLQLILPAGWDALPLAADPFFRPARERDGRAVVDLVRHMVPTEDSGEARPLHLLRPGSQFERRLTVGPAALLEENPSPPDLQGLAFPVPGRGLWSWSNPETASFFPQRSVLGTFERYARGTGGLAGLRADLEEACETLRAVIESGRTNGADVVANVMGWAHPWYIKAQGGTGGVGITTFEGHKAAAAASAPEVERIMLIHRMNISRQHQAMFDLKGDPVGFHAWAGEEGIVPFDFRTNGGMVPREFRPTFNGGPPPSSHVLAVIDQGRRPYYDRGEIHVHKGEVPYSDDNIWSFAPHDGQHMIRYTRNLKALVWLSNDPLAKDDLRLSAELFRLQFHEGRHKEESWSKGVTLRVYEEQVEHRPGVGAHLGRDHAWGIDAVSAYWCVADQAWRDRYTGWFERVARLLLNAAMPSGIVMRNPNPKILGHDRYDAAQTYQSLFLLHAVRTMNATVLRESNPALAKRLDRLTGRALDYLYFGPIWGMAPPRNRQLPAKHGPREAFAVAERGRYDVPPFCDEDHWGPDHVPEHAFAGGVETFYLWWALEYGYLSNDTAAGLNNRYLRRILDCAEGSRSYGVLLENLYASTRRTASDNSANWIGLAGRLQSLGVR